MRFQAGYMNETALFVLLDSEIEGKYTVDARLVESLQTSKILRTQLEWRPEWAEFVHVSITSFSFFLFQKNMSIVSPLLLLHGLCIRPWGRFHKAMKSIARQIVSITIVLSHLHSDITLNIVTLHFTNQLRLI